MVTEREYNGWRAAALAGSGLELIAPLDVGPRILSLARRGGVNLFYEVPGEQGGTGEGRFCLRGGHRLWHAPEHPVRTYQPDNDPVAFSVDAAGGGFSLEGKTENKTGMQKALHLSLAGDGGVRVRHRLTNRGLWPVPCAGWALTVLRAGGTAVLPFPPKGRHPADLLPVHSVVPWPYTDLAAPCWRFHPDHLEVDTRRARSAQKLGLTGYPGWSAYWLDGETFVKFAAVEKGARYPDLGCCVETFCHESLIELETLSPLHTLEPGESLEHIEFWGLLSGLPRPDSPESYRDRFLPAIGNWLDRLPVGGSGATVSEAALRSAP